MNPDHPTKLAEQIREQARLILAEAEDPQSVWDDDNMPKVWERTARILTRTATEIELVVKRYLEPALRLNERQFALISRSIGSRKGAPEQAAKLVLVHGKSLVDAAGETGLKSQGVYAAVERYRKASIEILDGAKALVDNY